MRRSYLGLGLLLILATSAHADLVDDTVTTYMRKRFIPGVSLAVFENGQIVKAQGYGLCEYGSSTPVTPATLFQAGSVSKPVAALGALKLVEAGKLSLDADVNDSLKSWRVPESDQAAGQKVTLRRLLSHSAGLTVHGFPGYASDKPLPTLVQILDGTPPANTRAIRVDSEPGSRWRYSGGGYTVTQQLMIDVTGRSFPDYMRENVLVPLAMSASTFEQPLPESYAKLAASGHAAKATPRVVPGRWHVYPEMAAAGLWTTPSDLARFAMAIQAAAQKTGGAILSPALTEEMLRNQSGDYGLGFMLTSKGASRRFTHGGRNRGFDSWLMAYIENGRGAIVMINANDDTDMIGRIYEAIADQYTWPNYPRRKPPQAIEDKAPNISALIVSVFQKIAESSSVSDLLTPELANEVEKQSDDLREQFATYGAHKTVELLAAEEKNGERNFRHRVIFERETLIVRTIFNAEGRIVRLNFHHE